MKEFKSPYFLYVGNAYPHKNLERAVKAAANLKVDLYIVSKKNIFIERLEKLTSKLNVQKYIKFLGFVEDDKLDGLREKSVGFIYPSLVEGFGLPGLEAMKTGTIVLCSDIPVFREIYQNHAIYFNPIEQNSIENAMKEILGMKKEDRIKRVKEAKEFVKKYSWKKMAKETLNIYENLPR